ncbi:hypothetical protein SPRG_06422 [Saprolegnia parasitica CBS 223.65]|uniref:Ion transport domain-containing protein n=1 Tax=Saprolegnia parasitica (strain CBS 223.65) TaxID=695850 RepID=A0A067CCS4_SAPPC|nr:hypothetical protein SPRG_06422 [Saprolegnia parasitica CBS 223.65]KDO28564.1 hypothetical protein SPRG_06422 [Saprolegnia parasitica CBS 223.65]|eukprot:XP_012200629.1 hypothetical protein SPRG_06422 [Saprolegnia parasitica CBS 223.65]
MQRDDATGSASDDDTHLDNLTLVELMTKSKESEVLWRLRTPGAVTNDDLTSLDEDGDSVLSMAALSGSLPVVQALIESTPYETIPNFAWMTMQRAVAYNQLHIVKYLWDILPNPLDLVSPTNGATLLHHAADHSAMSVLRWLLPRYPSVDVTNNDGETPYLVAISNADDECAAVLVAAGADIFARAADGDTALHYAIRHASDEDEDEDDVIETLDGVLAEGHSIDARNEAGECPADLTENARILALLEAEAEFRQAFPVHALVRTNKVDRFEAWLTEMRDKHGDDADEAIATALTAADEAGRTPLMHAALRFDALRDTDQVLYRLLPHLPADAVSAKDNEGRTALDMLARHSLFCAENPTGTVPSRLMRAIHAVSCKGKLALAFDHLPDAYLSWAEYLTGTAPHECAGQCKMSSTSNNGLSGLAAARNWTELRQVLQEPLSADVVNKIEGGMSVLHHVCEHGNVALLKLLLTQPHLDLNLRSEETDQSALDYAVDNDHVKIVRLLLAAGADPVVDDDTTAASLAELRATATPSELLVYDRWELALFDIGFFLLNLPNVAAARQLDARKQTAMHAAMRGSFSEATLDDICATDIDLDKQDEDGETALMVAASLGRNDYVKFLLSKSVNVDLQNKEGKTALMLAAKGCHITVVNLLLEASAEVYLTDKNDDTVLMQLEQELWRAGVEADDETRPQGQLLSLIKKELQIRENSPEYQEKQALSMVTMSIDDVFHHGGFAKAITVSAKLGLKFLNDCVTLHRHEAAFSHMEAVYGATAKTSALYAVLNVDAKEETFATKKAMLEHIVFRRLLAIKWELFGKRMYLQQLLMNVLLLFTMTTSSFIASDDAPSTAACVFGISAWLFVLSAFLVVENLEPSVFWGWARYQYDKHRALDPDVVIPDLRTKKAAATFLLYGTSVAITLLCVILLAVFAHLMHISTWFPTVNTVVLWLTALYFVVTERGEMRDDFRAYISSHTNKAQLLVYVLILFVFVPLKLNWINAADEVEFGISGFLTLALWVLSLQFLEVVPSASFLMPMMADLFKDIWNFFILFSVFQVGFTLTFYQLFRGMDDSVHKFGSLGQSFMTTYYVSFGELALDSLDAFGGSDAEHASAMYVATALLMMLHVAIMVIILLNVLLAMMNKTVDGGLEKAKTQALISYAQCILRLETSMNLTADDTHALIYLKTKASTSTKLIKQGEWLNPIFTECVPKALLDLGEDQAAELQTEAANRAAWATLVDELDATIDKELNYLRDALLHVAHFTSLPVRTVFADDLKHLESARSQLTAIVDDARKTRGAYRDKVLSALQSHLKKKLGQLKDKLLRLWAPKFDAKDMSARAECMLLFQMAQRSTIDAQLQKVTEAILDNVAEAIAPTTEDDQDDEKKQLHDEIETLKAKVDAQSETMTAMAAKLHFAVSLLLQLKNANEAANEDADEDGEEEDEEEE